MKGMHQRQVWARLYSTVPLTMLALWAKRILLVQSITGTDKGQL
jgi:hypothetical protein